MTVTVKYKGALREKTGTAIESVGCADVKELLGFIKKKYGKTAYKEARSMLITVNGINALASGLKAPFSEGDTVAFLPICGGG